MAVYFIQCGNRIKIGKSNDPWKRLAALQTGNPDQLRLLAIAPGNEDFEQGVQEQFSEYRVNGEWYESNGRLMAFIDSILAAFPDLQQRPQVKLYQARAETDAGDEGGLLEKFIKPDYRNFSLEIGESVTFRMSHKGHFRNPLTYSEKTMERDFEFYFGGFWKCLEFDGWYVMHASGLRFHMENEQYVTVTRVGDVLDRAVNRYVTKRSSLEGALNLALKNAIFNRKNSGPWLGVYNDDTLGITIAFSKTPLQDGLVRLDVPEEVIAYWRQYQYKTPLPEGVSIEA